MVELSQPATAQSEAMVEYSQMDRPLFSAIALERESGTPPDLDKPLLCRPADEESTNINPAGKLLPVDQLRNMCTSLVRYRLSFRCVGLEMRHLHLANRFVWDITIVLAPSRALPYP